jgi:type III restriction enzyme
VVVKKGFSELKPTAYTVSEAQPLLDFRVSPADKSNMARYLFGGFGRCLYPVQKFQSEPERILAVILEREAKRWFKPVKGQFQIYYKSGADHPEYQPDFVAETDTTIYMLEPKAAGHMEDVDVLAKRESAARWCENASAHSATYGGKPWKYALIPHDRIAVNMTIESLSQ